MLGRLWRRICAGRVVRRGKPVVMEGQKYWGRCNRRLWVLDKLHTCPSVLWETITVRFCEEPTALREEPFVQVYVGEGLLSTSH